MPKRSTAVVCALLLLIALVHVPVRAEAQEDYDPQFTMLALNMAVVSVYNIVSTQDRIVLDQEYENIINNLKLGNIEDDKEIKDLYDELLNVIFRTKLKEDERNIFKEKYDLRQKKVLYGSMKDFFSAFGYREKETKISSTTFTSNDTLLEAPSMEFGYFEIFSALGKLVAAGGSSYFGYRESIIEMHEELGDEIWRLQKEQMEDFDRLQRNLLSSSWSLLRKYRLPDEYRITQRDLEDFSKAVNEQDTNRAVRMFRALEQNFSAYPTFWFFYGRAAKKENNNQLEEKCLREFDRVWRPVLRLDPYRLEAAKYKVESLLERHASRDEILEQLRVIRDNAPRENWNAKLFLGVMHFALGDKKQGIEFVEENILFDVEDSLSGLVLRSMQQDKLDTAQLGKEFQSVLEEWIAEQEKQKSTAASSANMGEQEQIEKGLIAYFNNRDEDVEKIFAPLVQAPQNPVPLNVLGLLKADTRSKIKNITEGFSLIRKRDELKEKNESAFNAAYVQILPVVEKFAKDGNSRAQALLGILYFSGRGVPQDDPQAVEWFRKGAEQGEPVAQRLLGSMYKVGRSVPQDDRQAVEWYRKAAENQDITAQSNLGWMYMEGRGVPQDDRQAVEWLRKAAEQGESFAQRLLGWMYFEGRGVSQNDRQTVEWYRKAAEQGDAVSQRLLGWMYEAGRGGPQSDRQAVEWYRKAAEQGDAAAQRLFGVMYEEGRGGPQDDRQAVEWYRKAAEQGDAVAQYSLGAMYHNGRGVPQDDRQAVVWYRKSADQGDPPAQCLLGWMYSEGRGVPQDDHKAVEWYRKAADQGEPSAQHGLGWMYSKGRGVPQSYSEAYFWYYLSRLSGREDAQSGLDEIEGKGLFSLSKLSQEEIERARRRATQLYDEQRRK